MSVCTHVSGLCQLCFALLLIWLSFGGKYDLNKNSSINAAYSYIYIKNAKAQVNGYCGGSTAGAVNCVSSYTNGQADYKSHAHILGVQYNYQF